MACSGSLALGQKIRMVFEAHHAEFKAHPYSEHLPTLEQAIRVVVTPALQMAEKTRYVIPGAENNALACSLACIAFADGLRLCHVDYDGSIYCLTENLPYVTAGSGKINADPFIRFIWDVFWPDAAICRRCASALCRVLDGADEHRVPVHRGGDSGSTWWTVKRNSDGSFTAAATDWERIEPSGMFIETMKQAMRTQRDRTFGDEDLPAETPPKL